MHHNSIAFFASSRPMGGATVIKTAPVKLRL